MATYLVLYRSTESAPEQMARTTPEQGQANMAAWQAWADDAGDAVVDIGEPLALAFAVPDDGAGPDGLHVGGYSIMQADSADELRRHLEGHPHLKEPDARIEVHEALEMPGPQV